MNCKICTIHSDSIPFLLKKDEFWVVRHSEFTKNCPGYLYIEPLKHVESFKDIDPDAFRMLGENLKFAADWIYANFNPIKIYTITVSEAVPHIHYHLVPRYDDSVKGIDYIKLALSAELKSSDEVTAELTRIRKLF